MKTRKNIIYGLFVIISFTPYLYLFYDFTKIKFSIDNIVGFYPLYGFVSCIGLILFAKIVGYILKRDESYYDD